MAQKTVETIYLKNGSVIRGTVIEQVPGQSLKVQTKDGSVFVYQMNEVERITKEMPTNSGTSGKSGHRGLDFTMEGGVMLGKGGSAAGIGGIEIGKRFNQNFYWGIIGLGVVGGGSSDVQIPITTTFKALFPVTESGIAPNIALRTGFVANTADDMTVGSGKYTKTIEAKHSWNISLMPGIQIPLGQKVDFNLNLGYQCGISFGGGANHAFVMNAGFGFHKPSEKNVKSQVPTRDKGVQYSTELLAGFGSYRYDVGPAFILGYKMNPNLSVGLGYRFSALFINKEFKDDYDSYIYVDEAGVHSIFLRGHYRMTDNKFSPFASIDIGVRKYDSYFSRSSGFLFTPAIGASLRVRNNSYLEFKIGYNCTNAIKAEDILDDSKRIGLSTFTLGIGYTHTLKWGSGTK